MCNFRHGPIVRSLCILPFMLAPAGVAFAQADAQTEAVAELIALYEAADSECRLAMDNDPKTEASCAARSMYGVALNAQEWCYGREEEANAEMEWHQCEANSMRFSN